MPTDKPITLQEHAMRFGTFMGIFWIFKFIFLPLGFTIPLLQLLFVLLTLFVPVLGYIYVRKFRNTYCNGEISFFRAFLFTLYMYLFAALLAAVAHYVSALSIRDFWQTHTCNSWKASKQVPRAKWYLPSTSLFRLLIRFHR